MIPQVSSFAWKNLVTSIYPVGDPSLYFFDPVMDWRKATAQT